MVLMGGPIDPRRSPTAVNRLAVERGVDWFHRNCIDSAPFFMPGSAQGLSGPSAALGLHGDEFREAMSPRISTCSTISSRATANRPRRIAISTTNISPSWTSPRSSSGDGGEGVHPPRIRRGVLRHRGEIIDLAAIQRTALLTVEGEKDDISGVGQTYAAQSSARAYRTCESSIIFQEGSRPLRRFQWLALPSRHRPRAPRFLHAGGDKSRAEFNSIGESACSTRFEIAPPAAGDANSRQAGSSPLRRSPPPA